MKRIITPENIAHASNRMAEVDRDKDWDENRDHPHQRVAGAIKMNNAKYDTMKSLGATHKEHESDEWR